MPFSAPPVPARETCPNPQCRLSNKTAVTLIILKCLHLYINLPAQPCHYLCSQASLVVSGPRRNSPQNHQPQNRRSLAERCSSSPLREVCCYFALQMGSVLSKTEHLENQRSSRVRGKTEGQTHLSVHPCSATYQLGGLGVTPHLEIQPHKILGFGRGRCEAGSHLSRS